MTALCVSRCCLFLKSLPGSHRPCLSFLAVSCAVLSDFRESEALYWAELVEPDLHYCYCSAQIICTYRAICVYIAKADKEKLSHLSLPNTVSMWSIWSISLQSLLWGGFTIIVCSVVITTGAKRRFSCLFNPAIPLLK